MSPRLLTLLIVSSLFTLVSDASAKEIPGVSHRSRLYDSAAHKGKVLVVGYPGLVLRSSDHGKTFTPLDVPTHDALFSIDINKAGFGAIVGRGGLVLLTKDGGATWSKTNALTAEEGADKPHLFAVDVLESGTIVAVGDFATIVRSTDRGETWERATFDATDPGPPGAGEGEAAEAEPAEEYANEGFEDEARLTGISFGDEQRGYVVGEFGMVIATEDGGATWKRQHSGTRNLLFSVHATGATHAVTVGSDGIVLETRDGQTWSVVPTPQSDHLFGVWASDGTCIAVGADGAMIRRPSADAPFEVIPTNVHTWLSSVALHDGKHGVVAAGLGYLLQTDNGGKSFSIVAGE